jgi:hypothetical protein
MFSPDRDLNIHSSTTEEVIAALDLLLGLQDSYFERITIEYYHDDGRNGVHFCPLRGRHLEKLVCNTNREK